MLEPAASRVPSRCAAVAGVVLGGAAIGSDGANRATSGTTRRSGLAQLGGVTLPGVGVELLPAAGSRAAQPISTTRSIGRRKSWLRRRR